MHISRIEIENFRLLANAHLALEERTTLIVGRNNSGKTSLTELFRRLLSGSSPKFRIFDQLHRRQGRIGPYPGVEGARWDALDRLHKKGLISDPKSKAKSVVLSKEGRQRSEELFQRLFHD